MICRVRSAGVAQRERVVRAAVVGLVDGGEAAAAATGSTSGMFGTSVSAEAPPYVTVKPVAAAPVTVTVPAKPAMPLMAVWMLVLVYASPPDPISAESLPPMRTWKDEVVVLKPGPKVTIWTSFPPPKWLSDAVWTSLIAAWLDVT